MVAREYKKLKEIESERAKRRKEANLKQNSTDTENFPARENKGEARDLAAQKVGISGRTKNG